MDKAVQSVLAGGRVHYERRRPEETTLYTLVQEHLESFFIQAERETGAGWPDFVKEEELEALVPCLNKQTGLSPIPLKLGVNSACENRRISHLGQPVSKGECELFTFIL
jgi:hypothetical protein